MEKESVKENVVQFEEEEKHLNFFADFHHACRMAYGASRMSRAQVVDRMNELAEASGLSLAQGHSGKLTGDIFDKWMSADAPRPWPLKAVPVFCVAVNSIAPLKALAAPLDAEVIGPEDRRLLAWARAVREEKSARERKLALEKHL